MQPLKAQKKRRLIIIILILVIFFGYIFHSKYLSSLTLPHKLQRINQAIAAGTYKVSEFDDGDTIIVDMNGHKETVRFIGVDTPEVKDPRKPVQCFGKAASNYTKQLIGSQPVHLVADSENTNRDRYNRLLRYIYLPDGTLVNAEIIKQGYGFAYTGFPFTKKQEFKNYEAEARQQNRGLWSACQPELNQYGGYSTNPAN